MKPFKLPFNIQLERKYNEINTEDFLRDWIENEENRRDRTISMSNDLHIELVKFGTFEVDLNEIIDIALSKREFRGMIAQLIAYKSSYLTH